MTPVKLKPEHEALVAKFMSKSPGDKRWFTRGMRQLSTADQNKVWTFLEGKGFERVALPPERKGEYKGGKRQAKAAVTASAVEETQEAAEVIMEQISVPVLEPVSAPQTEPADDAQEESTPLALKPAEPTYIVPPFQTNREEPNSKRERVSWRDDEWDHLAELVANMRLNDPTPPLSTLVERAQQQFPEHRRRPIAGSAMLKPLLDRLETKFLELHMAVDECQRMRDRMQQIKDAPTKEQILTSLTNDEVQSLFRQKVLDQITPVDLVQYLGYETLLGCIPMPVMLGHLVRVAMENWGEQLGAFDDRLGLLTVALEGLHRHHHTTPASPNGNGHGTPRIPPRAMGTYKPKVVVIGMLPDQTHIVRAKLGDRATFNFIDKNRNANMVPDGTDIVLLWARFVCHGDDYQVKAYVKNHPETDLIIHHGGIKKMVGLLANAIQKKVQLAAVA